MIYNSFTICDSIEVYLWSIDESESEMLQECSMKGISTDDISAIKAAHRRCEILATRLLLHYIIGYYTPISHTAEGKPYLENIDTHISISHSADMVCIAYCTSAPIGVDIEHITPKILKVRHRVLSDTELLTATETDITANLICWTAKEAIFKAMQQPGVDFREHILLHNANGSHEYSATTSLTRHREWHVINRTFPTFIFALAWEK